ncbi:MAG: histidine--tRNA ligase [Candidatus Ryanbacteria bacterium RIFCSPHIGHO2_12_FULL_47_12b]|uniref:Histidine--tRNA ligase n=2 Tax=Candidatus Ryaniibacteriota TaxID=1817914 RepID=A0A1G2H6E1_9BACT|nr:MAG: Histidine-tRNA ligase [Parcubacteria group bacterium GW2011_GWA2_47_10b]OGZ46329.1 MAG: histidine--tRNA ligase [Candidatus Ryanbacteria bacterium RIFCSPHIGHO2_01_FULL_48_80]OGZ50231.1 MAG: histidine--tRNA ligase [Candidatus Ryanbacteria bacterium RIFCSPHIGHO2_02_FULL_47_25]OGZ51547.1 MAG: histidine--tRNA ligase [Candidatus Ryanbacteria bacterium RIFCSPHIGHO2_12_FULL_47_12b]OGZ52866.1 MAG: histidine--tRNA ligase [Candidatus Ryanbacteria bacterium RIFCSPLOWO2_01_FULL_47_79]OGZ56935.1 MAG
MPTSVKGMHDVLPEDFTYLERVIKEAKRVSEFYGCSQIATPHLEKTELFVRPLGDTSDVVEKQMYNLRTRGGDRLSLRPEATVSVMRAYHENGMQSLPQPVKLFSAGAFFRHENPQAGRFREFHQANIEIIGDDDAISDALVIRIFVSTLQSLGLKDIIININTLGDKQDRVVYRKELVAYYRKHIDMLCKDCKRRIKENPLRLLDCKVPGCGALKDGAPPMVDYLGEFSKKHFAEVLEYLDEISIPYFLDSHLVRGLDYYGRTIFEVFPSDADGENPPALGGGGRYDDLSEMMWGKRVPAVGSAMGVERVVDLMKKKGLKPRSDTKPKIFLIQLGPAAKKKSLILLEELRKIGVPIAQSLSKDSLRSQLNIVHKLGIPVAVILGQKEALDGTVGVRNMETGVQETLPFEKFIGTIKARLKEFS